MSEVSPEDCFLLYCIPFVPSVGSVLGYEENCTTLADSDRFDSRYVDGFGVSPFQR